MKNNNKGFSLVELLVSFAILGFVTAIISVMVFSGSNMFQSNKKLVDLQYKSQVVSAQLENYIQNCDGIAEAANGDIYLAEYRTNTIYVISKGKGVEASDDETDHLYLTVVDNIHIESNGGEYVIKPEIIDISSYTKQPLSSCVKDINYDFIKDDDGYVKIVKVNMDFETAEKSYSKTLVESSRSKILYLGPTQSEAGMSLIDTLKNKIWG